MPGCEDVMDHENDWRFGYSDEVSYNRLVV